MDFPREYSSDDEFLEPSQIKEFDRSLKKNLNKIHDSLDKNQPDEAFSRLGPLASDINGNLKKYPRLVKRLSEWIEEIRDVAANIAALTGAESYTVTVGLPVGISNGITYPARKREDV